MPLLPLVNASSAIDLVIDLSSMNKVTVLPKYKIYDGSTKEVVSYEGVSARSLHKVLG